MIRGLDSNGMQTRLPIKSPLLARTGKPEDIAQAAVYLGSDESSWVTGAIFCIDGGTTAY